MKLCGSKKQLYVPCIKLFLRDIDKTEEAAKTIGAHYNLEKLQSIYNSVHDYFSPRDSWHQYDSSRNHFYTTLVSDLLEHYMPIDDDERYRIAQQLDQ